MAEPPKDETGQKKTPAPPRTKRNPEQVRARIIEAAIAAFTRDGYHGARMRAIGADAGISIQLLVHHVKSKEMLWHMVMEHFLERFETFRSKGTGADHPATATDRLRQAISDLVHFAAHAPELHRIMAQEGGQLSPRLVWLTENLTRRNFDDLCQLIEAAQREGTVRAIVPGRLRFAIMAMTAVPFTVSAEYEFLMGKNPFSPGEIAATVDMITDMVLRP